MPDEVLIIKVTALLGLAEKSGYATAPAGEIPAVKVRGQWRVRRTELDQWIDAWRAVERGATMAGHEECAITSVSESPQSA